MSVAPVAGSSASRPAANIDPLLDVDAELDEQMRKSAYTQPERWTEGLPAPERWTREPIAKLHASGSKRKALKPWQRAEVERTRDLTSSLSHVRLSSYEALDEWKDAVRAVSGSFVTSLDAKPTSTGARMQFMKFSSVEDARKAAYLADRRGAKRRLLAVLRDGDSGSVFVTGLRTKGSFAKHMEADSRGFRKSVQKHGERHIGSPHRDLIGIINGDEFHDFRAAARMALRG